MQKKGGRSYFNTMLNYDLPCILICLVFFDDVLYYVGLLCFLSVIIFLLKCWLLFWGCLFLFIFVVLLIVCFGLAWVWEGLG